MTIISNINSPAVDADVATQTIHSAALDKAHLDDILDALCSTGTPGGGALAIGTKILIKLHELTERKPRFAFQSTKYDPNIWRTPLLDPLRAVRFSRIWMIVLRGYPVLARGLVLFRIFQLATVEP